MYYDLERAVINDDMDVAGTIVLHLICMGEFNHISGIFKKSRHYKAQDYLLNSVLDALTEFGKCL